ncbi:MAG: ATP synthase F1 subunit epsilon [Chloroflexota bacterium]
MPLSLSVVTAERTILQRDDVQRLIVPTTEGQITVLPMHVALMSSLDYGELTAVCGNETVTIAVFGGFIQVAHDQVTILADAAERAENINEERAEAARQRAERRVAGQPVDPGEVVNVLRARLALSRATLRLRVRRRRATGAPAMR